jgi:BirA family biotin operon repressor/biotin-[acetyl-CoA-carboxylase] ligase
MIVYTDDVIIAQQFLSKPVMWQSASFDMIHNDLSSLSHTIFKTTEIQYGTSDQPSQWKYLCITKHANISQFDYLCKISREEKQLPGDLLFIAASGENFKGYRNRSWISIPGNLHLSLFFTPQQKVPHFYVGFTIIAAISVLQTLDSIPELSSKSGIKWVNDILIDNHKVGGVLTQTQIQGEVVTAAIAGIGLNVEKTPQFESDIFVPQAACVWDYVHNRDSCTLAIIFCELIKNLSENYQSLLHGDYEQLLEFYISRSLIMGKEVQIFSDPREGKPVLISRGKVKCIGKDLEVYLEHSKDPIFNGRLAFET